MPRAALALGTHGGITVSGQVQDSEGRWIKPAEGVKPQRYRATCRYRDRDGKTLSLQRFGATRGDARRKLNQALADYDREQELQATKGTRATFGEVAATWLSIIERDPKRAKRTKIHYRYVQEHYLSEFDSMPLAEVNTVPVLREHLQQVADNHGDAAAKSARSVVSSVLGLAVGDGLVSVNAARGLRPAKAAKPKVTVRDTRRALTKEERKHLIKTADKHAKALALDVADIVSFMAGTGARISEALAVRWDDIDPEAGTVRIAGTKSKHSDRVLALPEALSERLARRQCSSEYVFPSPEQKRTDRPRDVRNVSRVMRQVLNAAGLEWATPHSLRRTAAMLLIESGQSPMQAAQQLGHSDPSFTLRTYGAKRPEPSKAAASALDW